MQNALYFVSPLRAFGQRMLTCSAHNCRWYAISSEFQSVELTECDQSLTRNYSDFTLCPQVEISGQELLTSTHAPSNGARSEDTTRSMLARRTASWFRWEHRGIVFVVKVPDAPPHGPRTP